MIAIVIPVAAVAIVAMGNAEHALHCTHGAADTGADRTTDHASDGTGDPVTFIGPFLGAAHDALSMTSSRQCEQCKQDGGGREQQADGQAGRQGGGGNAGFVHLQSQGSTE
ncbi:hypothetical protein XH79_39215 [Bradyrhizobium sp. CCBAU 45389]|nr:hypothetical protein [Bradyrhizobium sp. CCBAU 45389]